MQAHCTNLVQTKISMTSIISHWEQITGTQIAVHTLIQNKKDVQILRLCTGSKE